MAVAAALERSFADRCKLPELPGELAQAIYSWPVTLPPLTHMREGTQDLNGLIGLFAIAKVLGVQRVFEIGTFTGLTTLGLALNLPEATIHTLDLPPGLKPRLALNQHDANYLPGGNRRVYLDFPREASRIVQHQGDSADFAFEQIGQKFDLVYIDGAHSYEYVRSDTEAAFRIVAADGAIVWDDYSRAWPEVVGYLDEFSHPGTYCLPTIPRRLAVWFGNSERIRNFHAMQDGDGQQSAGVSLTR